MTGPHSGPYWLGEKNEIRTRQEYLCATGGLSASANACSIQTVRKHWRASRQCHPYDWLLITVIQKITDQRQRALSRQSALM